MDRGGWRATVHGVTKSRTRLSDLTLSLFIQSLPYHSVNVQSCVSEQVQLCPNKTICNKLGMRQNS